MKSWYTSKLVWLGVVQSLISILMLAQEWYARGDFSVPAIIGLVIGALMVVLRVWFTDMPIETPKAIDKLSNQRMDEMKF